MWYPSDWQKQINTENYVDHQRNKKFENDEKNCETKTSVRKFHVAMKVVIQNTFLGYYREAKGHWQVKAGFEEPTGGHDDSDVNLFDSVPVSMVPGHPQLMESCQEDHHQHRYKGVDVSPGHTNLAEDLSKNPALEEVRYPQEGDIDESYHQICVWYIDDKSVCNVLADLFDRPVCGYDEDIAGYDG